jgi:predicted MPP superfamily phosphohydrolase
MWYRVLFMLLSTATFVAINVYLYRRLVRDTLPVGWKRMAGAASIALLYLTIPLARFVVHERLPPPIVGAVSTSWAGVALYVFAGLLAVEVWFFARRRLRPAELLPQPVDEDRRLFVSRSIAAGALTVGTTVSGFGVWRAFDHPVVSEVPIRLPGLPQALDGFTIVQLSDIHVGAVIQDWMIERLIDTASSARPDLVAITGDLVDGSPALLAPIVERFARLRSRFGTYFVSGNHDYYSGWERWVGPLEKIGFNVLRNRLVTIGDAGGSFDLLGVEDFGSSWQSGGYDLKRATHQRNPDRASVLLAHQPQGVEEAAAYGIGLQLSGHTHGGQMFPGNLVGKMVWGDRNAGLSRCDNLQLYTSRGCGFVGPPMRVAASPEVVKLILMPA